MHLKRTGCPIHDVKAMLRAVGLRPTRQRMALGWMLFARGDRHVTAEMLFDEAAGARVPVSLATVYNTLHQFTALGMLREAQACIGSHGIDNACILRMDAVHMAFPDSTFDGLMAAYVITAVPDYRLLMAEMVRVCKPGGRIVFVNHLSNRSRLVAFGQRLLSPITQRLGWRTDISLEDVLAGTPLEVTRVTTVAPFGLWYLVECRNAKPA
jgi:SAM-dependent methyltransferase